MKMSRILPIVLLALAFAAPVRAAYPNKPIFLIVGYTPGGGTDIFARILAKDLSTVLGTSVVVENRPGAGQNIGASYVARARSDGYTLLLSTSALGVNLNLYPHLDYDPVTSFAPVALFARSPNLLLVNAQLPVHSVQDLAAYARSHPGQVSFSSSGFGSTQHLSGELLRMATDTQMLHVPYRGTAPSLEAVAAGQVQFTFCSVPSAEPLLGSGLVRPIAVTSSHRLAVLPDVPTMAEEGQSDFDVAAWYGVLAPAGTPSDIVALLNHAVVGITRTPEFRRQVAELGSETMEGSPDDFAAYLKAEIARWKDVIEHSHATVN